MRFVLLVFSTVVFTALCASSALAHGGRYGSGPPPPWRAPSIPCDCAQVDCPKCSAPGLAEGKTLSKRETKVETVNRWGDIRQVRITTTIETNEEAQSFEAFASVEVAPLLAVTDGEVWANDQKLVGALREAELGRRDYIWERDRRKRDPLLVQRHDAGTVHLRVFPVRRDIKVRAVIEGFAISEPRRSGATGVRVYRTGLLHVVVVPLTHPAAEKADFRDEAGKRAFLLCGWRDSQEFLRAEGCVVREIPCADALRSAILGEGLSAVTGNTVLLALPKGSRAPSDLFVGDAKDAPVYGGVPPEPPPPPTLREPNDPTPPPPPPEPVPQQTASTGTRPASGST